MKTSQDKDRILVVDDSTDTLEVIRRNLEASGFQVLSATRAAEALEILDGNEIDLVITDLKMPKVTGLELIRHIRENHKNTEVMMITGYATIEGAVTAIKTGADEYLPKPFTDTELVAAVRRSLDKLHLRKAGEPQPLRTPRTPHGLIGESEPMLRISEAIDKAAPANATVLITGESGTGKELVARAIHYRGDRASAPFVPVNCGGIPEGLLESEIFGHVKGSFTGAIETRAGFFQTADGGTIFLDEISETCLSMQVKLLRVLQSKEVCMVGSGKPQEVDVRIIAATNKDLLDLVDKGLFREDLFYRLNVITIALPPLRERGDDILTLINYFAARYAEELGKASPKFSDTALRALRNYQWPGNVRELENVIQRLIIMNESDLIEAPDLPRLMRFSALRTGRLQRTLAEVEAEHMRNVLAGAGGNKTKAAEILGIDRKTLRERLKDLKVED